MGKLTEQDLSFADTAPYIVSATFNSPHPAEAVFKVLADHHAGVKWIGMGVTAIYPTSVPETGVGCTRTVTLLYGLGKLEERFIAWEEPRIWAFTGTGIRPKVFTKFLERITLEPLPDHGCRIHYRAGIDFISMIKPLARIIVRFLTGEISKALKSLSDTAAG